MGRARTRGKPWRVDALEPRRLLSFPIAATGVNDLVYDPTRDLLYMPTSGGGVRRFDVANRVMLSPISVPGTLLAGDITPDGSKLYLTANDAGVIRKVDLATGTYTSLSYGGFKPIDIAVAANGKALFTTTYPGSGFVPVWQIDTATDAFSTRSDYPGGTAGQDSHIGRAADGSMLLLAEGNRSTGPLTAYRSSTNSFPHSDTEGTSLSNVRPAVNRDGSLGSFRSPSNAGALSVRNLGAAGLPQAASIRYGDGAIFSPTDDRVYVSMRPHTTGATTQYIACYDTNTWQLLSVIAADTPVLTAPNGATAISDDGRYLFMQNVSGVTMYDTVADALPAPIQLAGDGTLTVSGFDGNDVIDVSVRFDNTLLTTINGVTLDVPASSVTKIVVAGAGGDDSLTLGNLAGVPVDFDGGAGSNTLAIRGTGDVDTITLDGSHAAGTLGPVTTGGPLRTLDVDFVNAATVTVDGGDGADILSAYNAPAGSVWTIRGGIWGGDTFARGPAAGRIDMYGAGSGSTFVASGSDGADDVFVHGWAITGELTYRFNGVENIVASMNSLRFNLLGGDDRGLVGNDQITTPTIIDGGAGNDTLGQRTTATGGTAISRPITYLGGADDDRFFVADRKIYTIDGGDGIDGMVADAEDIVSNVEHVATASITGTVFNDADRDGVRDAGETGLDSAFAYVDENNDGAWQAPEYRVTTGSTGNYTLGPLMAGTYVVRVLRPANQPHLTATGAAGLTFTVGWGGSTPGANFGFAPRLYPATEGMPDANFGQFGNATADYNNRSDTPVSVGMQSSGRIIVAGYNQPQGSSSATHEVRRFNADGSVDTTFANGINGGSAQWDLPGGSSTAPDSAIILPDDRILLAGGTGGTPGLSLLTANGLLDTTFNGTGTAMASTVNGGFADLALLPDGRFYVTGWAYRINNIQVNAPFIARYHATGIPDASFGPSGIQVLPVTSNRMVQFGWEDIRVQVDAEGRALVLLPTRQNPSSDKVVQATLLRVRSDGAIDTTFGIAGEISIKPGDNGTPDDFDMLPDGRMVISGHTLDSAGLSNGFFVARLLPDGTPDTSFGTHGFVVQSANTRSFYGQFAAPTADGKLVLLTATATTGGIQFNRLTADGQPDLTFAADSDTPGTMDVWIPPRTGSGTGGALPRGLIVQPDGKPLAVAMVSDRGWDFALARQLGANPNAGKPTAKLTPSKVTLDEGAALSVTFSDVRAADGSSTGTFRYSFDFDDNGTWDLIDSSNPSAAVPASMLDGPAVLRIRGRVRESGVFGPADNTYATYVVVNNVAPRALILSHTSATVEGSTGARMELGNLVEPSAADLASLKFSYDFDGDGTWDVVDSSSKLAIVPDSYYADGPRTLDMRARVADKDGGFIDYTMTLQVSNTPPRAMAGSDRTAVAGQLLTFSGQVADVLADVVSAAWAVRDAQGNSVGQGNGLELAWLPPAPGTYTAELTATDDDGASATDAAQITIAAPAYLAAAAGASYHFASGAGEVTLNVVSGHVTFTSDVAGAHGDGGLNVNVAAGATASFASSQHLAGLTVSGTVTLAPGANKVLRTADVIVPAGGRLDLTDNDLIVDYDTDSRLQQLGLLLAAGFNGGDWLGTGITSSAAADDPRFSLGAADNAALPLPFGNLEGQGGPLFAGEDVDLTAVLIKFTWTSDVTLDGVMDFQDLSLFNGNYDSGAISGRLWSDGDSNYDGLLDFQDLSLFNGNYDPNKPRV